MKKRFERKTVYIYELNGQEKIKVTTAEEAAHWDEVFELAEQVDQLLLDKPPSIKLNEEQRTEMSLYLAQQRDELGLLFGGAAVEEGKDESKKDSKDGGKEESKDAKPKLVKTGETEGVSQAEKVKKQDFVKEFKRPVEPLKDGFSI
ncbi:YebG family protein [Motiliproteus sp.]|uniref:YebG family protein n=1 Tax=Motiliproteus sp. TaxID=1898955 RepID=UPI003BA85D53